MAQLFKNAAVSALTAPIAAADTSLTVNITQADLFPAANTGANAVNTAGLDWFKACLEDVNGNIEITYVRTRTLGSAVMSNVLRGQEGTTALSFATGSVVELRLTSLDLQSPINLAAQATTPGTDLLWAANVDAQVQKLGSALQKQLVTAYTTDVTGTSTAYKITPTPAITAYTANLSFDITFDKASGNNPTLQISGLATPPTLVKELFDGSYANVVAGDITINHRSTVTLLSSTQALVKELPQAIGRQIQTLAPILATVGGTATAITATTAPATSGVKQIVLTIATGNGGAATTLAANGDAPKSVKALDATGALVDTTTLAGQGCLFYDMGTYWLLVNALPSSPQIFTAPTPTLAANAMTIPSAAFALDFRSTTLGSGAVTRVSGSPTALTIPSGATLGTTNAVQSDIYVLALNNAGTLEYAVVNGSGGVDLSETGLISTTAISAASGSANVVYSTTARTNVSYRVVGLYRSTQTTAGTWAQAMSLIQGYGGNALAAMSSLGYGQTVQSGLTRTSGTTYYNTTGKPIFLHIRIDNSGTGAFYSFISINGAASFLLAGGAPVTGAYADGSMIIPVGASYAITDTNCTRITTEVRQ